MEQGLTLKADQIYVQRYLPEPRGVVEDLRAPRQPHSTLLFQGLLRP